MTNQPNKFYFFVSVACFTGYLWLWVNFFNQQLGAFTQVEACFIKKTTSIPCPSCGSTRSLISLIQGDFSQALYFNPIGFVIAIIMIVAPIWLITDLIVRKKSFYIFFKNMERILQKKIVFIPLTIFFILNWIWNITKAL